MSPVKIDAAKRQLFSFTQSQNIKLQEEAANASKASPVSEAAAKRTAKEPSPAVDVKKEQPNQQNGVASGPKLGKVVSFKRKRKDETDTKVWPSRSSYIV